MGRTAKEKGRSFMFSMKNRLYAYAHKKLWIKQIFYKNVL